MTAPHLARPSSKAKAASLQDVRAVRVSASGKTLLSPIAQPDELAARRKAERLDLASSNTPVRNSTVSGPPYTCPELRANPDRPRSADAFQPPSRTQFS